MDTYKSNIFIKKVHDIDLEEIESIEETTLREAYYQMKARRLIKNVPKVYAVDEDEIAMEKIEAERLSEKYKKLSQEERILIIEQVKRKLDILNKNDVYHKDLHTDNILIDKNNQVWLIDFGYSSYKPGHIDDFTIFMNDLQSLNR